MSLSDLPGPVPDPLIGASRTTTALAEPVERVRGLWVTGVVLVNLGINAAFFGPLQVLLGQQAEHFNAAEKEAILALVTGCGAAVSLVANPLFGAFSDRTTSRYGRRVHLGPDGGGPCRCGFGRLGRCPQRCRHDLAVVPCAGRGERHVRCDFCSRPGQGSRSTAGNGGRFGRYGPDGRHSGRRGDCRRRCR